MWEQVLAHLADQAGSEYVILDSTIVRVHQHSAVGSTRRAGPSYRPQQRRPKHQNPCQGGCVRQSNRLHPQPWAQAHDLKGVDALLPNLDAGALIADKAFNADVRVFKPLKKAGMITIIMP